MISPELLRRYPFFGSLSDAQLKAVAMISEEVNIPANTDVVKEGQPATYLYLLLNGDMDLYFAVSEEQRPDVKREFLVGHINPEEVFGISAVINPTAYSATARTVAPSRVLKVDGEALRNLGELDSNLAYKFVFEVARSTLERLNQTRVQLAAAWI